jgi:hypothetical protein
MPTARTHRAYWNHGIPWLPADMTTSVRLAPVSGHDRMLVYMLDNLRRMRQEVTANPQWFDPDALERIDQAIASLQEAWAWQDTKAA